LNVLDAFARAFANLTASGLFTLMAVMALLGVLNMPYLPNPDGLRDIAWPTALWLLFVPLTGYLAYAFRLQRNSHSIRACFYLNTLSCALFIVAGVYFFLHVPYHANL